ncbi:MAG: dehydrogenase, partial [Actinobacteria bacterium]|nr:dehydrogenase [Actinomycetota bacterium]
VRGGADDDVVLTLKHESGVDSYLAASAVIGSPGPRVRLNTTEGTLIFSQLDKQEDLLRKGYRPIGGEWSDATAVTSEARVIAGEKSFGYPALPGNYAAFYSAVKDALLAGQSMPVTRSQALAVAEILDQARRIG